MNESLSLEALRAQRARRADKIFICVIILEFIYTLILAAGYDAWNSAFVVGIPLLTLALAIYFLSPATRFAACLHPLVAMCFVMLHIHQAQGLIEMHFGVFVTIAFTAIYRDWLPFIVIAVAIAAHHALFCYLQHHGYGVWLFRDMDDHWVRVLIHASYVVAETVFFLIFTQSARKDVEIGDILTVTTQRMMMQKDAIDFRVNVESDNTELHHFARLIESLKQLLRDVQHVSSNLAISASAVDEKREHLHLSSESMQKDMIALVSSIETLSAAVHDIAANANAAATAVENAYSDEESLRDVVESSQAINSQLSNASEKMENLNRSCHAIDDVVAVITSIAEQTNLLALNAAIEAARAGEDGRGFAVVAEEVRALAGRTRESTDEIVNLIKGLQSDSENTLAIMEECKSISAETEKRSLAVAKSLDTLKQSLGNISELSQSIAAATQEQDSVSRLMTENAHRVEQKNAQVQSEVQTLGEVSAELIAHQQRLYHQMKNLIIDNVSSGDAQAAGRLPS